MILKQRYFTQQNEDYLKKVAKYLGLVTKKNGKESLNVSQALRMVLTRAEQLGIMLDKWV